jgi:hypothetical protein
MARMVESDKQTPEQGTQMHHPWIQFMDRAEACGGRAPLHLPQGHSPAAAKDHGRRGHFLFDYAGVVGSGRETLHGGGEPGSLFKLMGIGF